jgi:hypothetical protein
VEPFAGSAAYAVHHRLDVDRVVLVERDERVVALWHRLLASSVDELLAMQTPVAGGWSSDLLVAFAAGRTTRDTPEEFQVSPRMAQRFRPMIERVARVLDECKHFEVHGGDYTIAPDLSATWFIDPPYQYRSGRWDRTRGGRYLYSNRDIDFAALGAWSQTRQGQVIVCEQFGSDWLPWNGGRLARDNTHTPYGEVWWHRPNETRTVTGGEALA